MPSTVSPKILTTPTSKIITLAAGCFWGVEKVFRKQFTDKGLIDIRVGYANGIPTMGNVNYEQVCSGSTNFVESVQLSYEPQTLKIENIYDIFFRMHDPTTVNSQGPDVGTQYRSAILTSDEEQNKIAWQVKEQFQKEWYPNHKIVTIIEPIKVWHDAEDYHQKYLEKNPSGYECSTHFLRTKPKV
ncbi:mxr1 [Candida oxycetoniae]|uniref:peptide-methionine (S)-S-oxide reductase n=1 Tax=Candida oxycetoniae TaxID=497107 RepID=A0AAI9ST70_9ASCO|nr:mxr1 [Candida oxycetoniae]KAI3402424.1 mxr1 [Candida oxycetoniae]